MGSQPNPFERAYKLIVNVALASPHAIEGDEREPPAIGYYRTYVVRARDLGDAHRLVMEDVQDGQPRVMEESEISLDDGEWRAPRGEELSPGVSVIVWCSGRIFYQEKAVDEPTLARRSTPPWYRRLLGH